MTKPVVLSNGLMRSLLPSAGALLCCLMVAAGASLRAAELPPDDPLRGRALFEEKSCIRCHGIEQSHLGGGPSLGDGHFKGSFLDLGAALWNHAPQMSASLEMTGLPWPELSEDEAAQLLVFFYFIDYLGRPGDGDEGRRVFRSGGCPTCHSLGAGRSGIGPDLSSFKSHASPLAVAQGIWNHGPAMLRQIGARGLRPPVFQAGDLADLSAYIRMQAGSQPQRPVLLAPGNPNRGRELFSAKGCSRCHGTDAQGGAQGPDLSQFELQTSAEAIAGLMWNHSLVMNQSMQEMGIPWPRFEGSELGDLVAFLYFLPFRDGAGNAARGRQIFEERSCAGCHTPGQEGPSQGPDLKTPGEKNASALVAAMWNHAPLMKKAILGKGLRWPGLSGQDLRDLRAYLGN